MYAYHDYKKSDNVTVGCVNCAENNNKIYQHLLSVKWS